MEWIVIFIKILWYVDDYQSSRRRKTRQDKTWWYLNKYVFPVLKSAIFVCTVYSKKYAHGFVVLCFVVVMQSFIMNSHEVFIHIHQGCFAGTGAIVRLPQCQWSKPDGYGKISQCITTTKHSKAKTVCIFLGIYCMCVCVYSEMMIKLRCVIHDKSCPSYILWFDNLVGFSIYSIICGIDCKSDCTRWEIVGRIPSCLLVNTFIVRLFGMYFRFLSNHSSIIKTIHQFWIDARGELENL